MKLILLFLISFNAFAVSADRQYNIKQYVSGTATSVSTLALANYSYRCNLIVNNTGAVAINVKINSAHTSTEGYPIAAGANWQPSTIPVGSLFIKTAGASTSTFEIQEGSCL